MQHGSISEAFLPTRLVDLGVTCDSPLRLVDNSDIRAGGGFGMDSICKYATLSYCWGPPVDAYQQPKFTQATRIQFYKEIPLEGMTPVLHDVIIVCRALQIRYIWIDALCRVQGDPNDKARGISNMAQIYQNALLTVSAASGCSSVKGFLPARKPRYYPISTFWHGDSKFYINPLLHIRCLNNAIVATGSPPYI